MCQVNSGCSHQGLLWHEKLGMDLGLIFSVFPFNAQLFNGCTTISAPSHHYPSLSVHLSQSLPSLTSQFLFSADLSLCWKLLLTGHPWATSQKKVHSRLLWKADVEAADRMKCQFTSMGCQDVMGQQQSWEMSSLSSLGVMGTPSPTDISRLQYNWTLPWSALAAIAPWNLNGQKTIHYLLLTVT